MAAELVQAVREHLANEVAKVIGGRNGRTTANGVTTRRRGSVSDAVLDQLLKVAKASPGLRSEQIYKKLPQHSPKILKAGLARLRAQKKVKTRGERRSTTYRVA